jgi:hypothetical protein
MTANAVKELLVEYAEQARYYDVGVRALARGKRRRRIRHVLPAVVVAVVVLVAVVSAVPYLSADPIRTPLVGYPTEIVPVPNPPPLPVDAVGQGLLVYERAGRQPVMVTMDGREYLLPRLEGIAPEQSSRLSPDGRWLTHGDAATTLVRDLTATGAAWMLPGFLVAWSPDARWFALDNQTGSAGPRQIDLYDTTAMTLTAPATPTVVKLAAFTEANITEHKLVAILNNRDLVFAARLGADPDLVVIIVDPATGETHTAMAPDLAPYLTAQERAAAPADPDAFVATDDGQLLVRIVRRAGSAYRPTDVITIPVASPTETRRWRLPKPSANERWDVLRVVPEGLLLLHRRGNRLVAIELHAAPDGPTTVVTDLSRLPAG